MLIIFANVFLSVADFFKNKAMPIKYFAWYGPVEVTSRTDKEFNFRYVPKIFIEREWTPLK